MAIIGLHYQVMQDGAFYSILVREMQLFRLSFNPTVVVECHTLKR